MNKKKELKPNSMAINPVVFNRLHQQIKMVRVSPAVFFTSICSLCLYVQVSVFTLILKKTKFWLSYLHGNEKEYATDITVCVQLCIKPNNLMAHHSFQALWRNLLPFETTRLSHCVLSLFCTFCKTVLFRLSCLPELCKLSAGVFSARSWPV